MPPVVAATAAPMAAANALAHTTRRRRLGPRGRLGSVDRIALPTDRPHQVGAELAADARDDHVEARARGVAAVAPDALQDLGARDEAAAVGEQQLEDRPLARRDRHL